MSTTRQETGHLVTRAVPKISLARVQGGRVHRVAEVTIDWDQPGQRRVRTKPECGRASHRYVEVRDPIPEADLCRRCFPDGPEAEVIDVTD